LVAAESQPTRADQFIRIAFEQILARDPTSDELIACREFLAEQSALLSDSAKLTTFSGGQAAQVAPSADPALRSRENLVHVLLNHNDFVTVR
jgi:uracil-DNA glycosylase